MEKTSHYLHANIFRSSGFFPLTYHMFMFPIHLNISGMNAAAAAATLVKLRWVVSQLGLVLRILFFSALEHS